MSKKKIDRCPRVDRSHIAVAIQDKARFQRLAGHRYDWQAFQDMLDFYEKHYNVHSAEVN